MNTAATNEVATHEYVPEHEVVPEHATLEKARFLDLLDETFACAGPHQSGYRVPSFYPNYHCVRMSISPAQSYSSDASVTLKLKADRYTLSVT